MSNSPSQIPFEIYEKIPTPNPTTPSSITTPIVFVQEPSFPLKAPKSLTVLVDYSDEEEEESEGSESENSIMEEP